MSDIPTRIKKLRGKKSQAVFSDEIGISQRRLSRYESEESKPDADVVTRICSRLGVEPRWLLFGEGPMYTGEPVKEEPQAAPDLSLEAEVKMLKELLAAKNGTIEAQEETIDALKRVVAECDSRGNLQPPTNRIQPMPTSESPPNTDAPKNGHTQEMDLE